MMAAVGAHRVMRNRDHRYRGLTKQELHGLNMLQLDVPTETIWSLALVRLTDRIVVESEQVLILHQQGEQE